MRHSGNYLSDSSKGFIPTAAERYVQLLIPALEVTVGCLSAIGTSVISVMRQARYVTRWSGTRLKQPLGI